MRRNENVLNSAKVGWTDLWRKAAADTGRQWYGLKDCWPGDLQRGVAGRGL